MSIYQYMENVIAPIFLGLREDVKSWLVPTICIVFIMFLILGLFFLLFKVLKSLIPSGKKNDNTLIVDNEEESKKPFKRKNKKFY